MTPRQEDQDYIDTHTETKLFSTRTKIKSIPIPAVKCKSMSIPYNQMKLISITHRNTTSLSMPKLIPNHFQTAQRIQVYFGHSDRNRVTLTKSHLRPARNKKVSSTPEQKSVQFRSPY